MPPPVADDAKPFATSFFNRTRSRAGVRADRRQARATPTVSALSIGGLIKHVTGCQRMWMLRVASAPDAPPADDRPVEERQAEYADEFVMRADETLSDLLDRLARRTPKRCGWSRRPTWRGGARSSRRPVVPETSRRGPCAGCSSP